MKLKTSFFNPTVFQKDLTRFAPFWGLYTVFLLMFLMIFSSDATAPQLAEALAGGIGGLTPLHMIYAVLVAQLLFGDLYHARLCNALHAMPLRRECWFFTHVLAGLAFSLVPNLLICLVALPMLGNGWSVALWLLLGATLEYLFFFGLAVFCVFCVGNRFAQILVYGILNFLSMLALWFTSALYEPLLKGVFISSSAFINFCPVVKITSMGKLLNIQTNIQTISTKNELILTSISVGQGWGYVAACAVIGVVLLGLALLLYRRRKLESAGDFMAVKTMAPVFLVIYTLCAGAFCMLFSSLFGTQNYIYLAVGIVVGFFTGRMLLHRTTRVFQKKAFLGLGLLSAVLILSLFLAKWDVFGVVTRIPELDEIQSVSINDGSSYYAPDAIVLSDPEDIENIRYVHGAGLGLHEDSKNEPATSSHTTPVFLRYKLKNGTTLSRYYEIDTRHTAGQILTDIFTRPKSVLGVTKEDLPTLVHVISGVIIDHEYQQLSRREIEELLEAIVADCEAGAMAQVWGLHNMPNDYPVSTLEFEIHAPDGLQTYKGISVYKTCVNTLSWLQGHNFLPEFEDPIG